MDSITEETDRLLAPDSSHEKETDAYGAITNGSVQDTPAEKKDSLIIYKRRWYIVTVYSMFMIGLGASCNSYGPIANSSMRAYGWDNSDIALLGNWPQIAFVVFIGPFAWLMDYKGLRISCVLSALAMAIGTGLRCVTDEPPLVDWLNNIGMFLIGVSSPVAYSGPSLVSSTWFPVEQRTIGTAISSIAYGFGPAIIFVLGPVLVPVRYPDSNSTDTNHTLIFTTAYPLDQINGSAAAPTDNSTVPAYIQAMRKDILFYNWLQFGFCALVFVLMLAYFPAKPPTPPSASAGTKRTEFREGIKLILRNQRFWILGFVYSATNGLYTTFAGVLDINLIGAGIPNDQEIAGYMALFSVIALTVIGMIVAKIADIFLEKIKPIMIGLCIISGVLLLWFTLIIEGIIPPSLPSLYISFVAGACAINAGVPLFYELACECTYPVAEGLTNGVLNLLNNVFSMFFLFALMIPNIGTSWMNWTMVVALFVCVPILIPYKQKFGRRELDKEIDGNQAKDEEPFDEETIHTPKRKLRKPTKKRSDPNVTRGSRSNTISIQATNGAPPHAVNGGVMRSQSAPDMMDL